MATGKKLSKLVIIAIKTELTAGHDTSSTFLFLRIILQFRSLSLQSMQQCHQTLTSLCFILHCTKLPSGYRPCLQVKI